MPSVRTFVLTEKLPKDQKFRGQARLIIEAMQKAAKPLTAKQTADAIVKELETRQDPERVVNFYMSVWKKKGWVKVAGEVEAPAAEEKKEDEVPENGINPEDAESVGASEKERAEAAAEADVEAAHAGSDPQEE